MATEHNTTKLISGRDIIYSLVAIKPEDVKYIRDCKKYHQIVGYIVYDEDFSFYSVEDNYTIPILSHWTTPIVANYDNESCWLLIKEHPCKLYSIITEIYKGNMVCNVNSFDIWKSTMKNCLVAMVTSIEID
jgi:hypothetical protein